MKKVTIYGSGKIIKEFTCKYIDVTEFKESETPSGIIPAHYTFEFFGVVGKDSGINYSVVYRTEKLVHYQLSRIYCDFKFYNYNTLFEIRVENE